MRLDKAQMKTLKSQLRLRPSYNELIKDITKEEFKNQNIRNVIDRHAYYFRDSPLGTVYDNNTVGLRQRHFKEILDGENQATYFDMARDDEMDDLRDGSIQTLSASMDDAEEQHERPISQISKRLSSEQIADLHQRAQRARQLEEKDEWQSVATAKSSNYDDLPALEPLMTQDEAVKRIQGAQKGLTTRKEDEAVKRIQGAQRGLMTRKEDRIEQKMDTAGSSSTLPARQTRTHKKTVDYSTDMKHWNQKTNVLEKDLLFQLHLRGIELTKEQQHEYENETKKKGGKGKKETGRTIFLDRNS